MSATGRGGSVRTEHDFYGTPAWVLERLLEAVPALTFDGRVVEGGILEPCAGDGALVRAYNAWQARGSHPSGWTAPDWTLIDIRPETLPALELLAPGRAFTADFLQPDLSIEPGEYAALVTNPPYETAAEFIRKTAGRVGIAAFLLRLNFLASAERQPLFAEIGVPDVYVLPDRPCYKRVRNSATGKTTSSDSTEYAWMLWRGNEPKATSGLVRLLATTPSEVRTTSKEQTPIEDEHGNLLWDAAGGCRGFIASKRAEDRCSICNRSEGAHS